LEFQDDTEPWYIDPDATGAKNIICLEVLAEVVYRTEGRVQQLTKAQAKWIIALYEIDPNLNSWTLYKRANQYLRLVQKELSTLELDMHLAVSITPEKLGRTYAAVDGVTIDAGREVLMTKYGAP
jgi:hypothetical protein